jgi:hypothetical protein
MPERQKDAALADSALVPLPTTAVRRGAEISRGSAVGRGSARHGGAQPQNFAFNATSTDASYLAKIWPTVFILGIQKGGTTTLAHFLLHQSGFCKNNGPWGGKESTFLLPHKNNNPADYYTITGVDQKCSRRAQPADWEPARMGTGTAALPCAKGYHEMPLYPDASLDRSGVSPDLLRRTCPHAPAPLSALTLSSGASLYLIYPQPPAPIASDTSAQSPDRSAHSERECVHTGEAYRRHAGVE